MRELFFSTDIESDGPIPGINSMLSFGTAVFDEEKGIVGTFSHNLELIPDAAGDPDTMRWWREPAQAEAWRKCRENLVPPEQAMLEFAAWVESYQCSPVFVAYPAGFDFTWIYWYLMRFAGKSPFSFSAVDMKTYANAILGGAFKDSSKRNFPKSWFPVNRQHTHVALDDSIEQGLIFMNMRREAARLRGK